MENKATHTIRHHRFKSIDSLRGIAAVLVMILHITHAFFSAPNIKAKGHGLEDFFRVIDFGRIGITLFFIISGFVICKSFNYQKKELKGFILKRFFRLYPLFWFSIIASAIFVWNLPNKTLDLSTLFANITMLPAFFRKDFMIGLYWSLETELIFYLLAALLYYFGLLRKSKVLIGMTLLLFFVVGLFHFIPMLSPSLPHWKATPYHLGLMLMGVSLRYAFDVESETIKEGLSLSQYSYLHIMLVTSVPVAIIAMNLLTGHDSLLPDAYAYLIGIITFLLGQQLLKSSPKWLVHIGTISYSLYLLHPVVFIIVKRYVAKTAIVQGYHISVYIIICTLITIVVSYLTYFFIERPFNHIGRSLTKR